MLLQSALAQNPAPAEPILVELERSRDWRVEQFISTQLDENGKPLSVTNSWTSLATGMHYFDGNAWVNTVAAFEETPEMFIAQNGPHKVILNRVLGTPDAVDLLTEDGTRLRSAPAMLAYRNRVTGESVLLGEVRADARGELVEPNTVLWREAFDSVPGASVRAVYTAAGFEMDVVLSEALPDPSQFGLADVEQVDLEVFTAFQEGAEPVKFPYTVADGLQDERLDFGTMTMGVGKAFSINQMEQPFATSALVRKTFQRIEGGNWLIESVPLVSVKRMLENLSADKEGAQIDRNRGKLPGRMRTRILAANRKAMVDQAGLAQASAKSQSAPGTWNQRLARGAAAVEARGGGRRSASLKGSQGLGAFALQTPERRLQNIKKGVVIDYYIVNSASTYTFRSDRTYLVQGAVNISGIARFEAGTVIKYTWTNYARIILNTGCTMDWQAAPYSPIIFTAEHDNSAGEIIAGNTNVLLPTHYYPVAALELAGGVTIPGNRLENFRISHAITGLDLQYQHGVEIRNAQFVNSRTGIQVYNGGPMRNLLFHHVTCPVFSSNGTPVSGEQLTVNKATWFPYNLPPTLAYLTNSLIVDVSTYTNWTGVANTYRASSIGTFSTNGAGHHYLADPSLRGVGTTVIHSSLATELKSMTTVAPVHLSEYVTIPTVLEPIVPRNTGLPDIGYHYWPVDWTWSKLVVTNTTLTLTNGVVVANYGGIGTEIQTGGTFVSGGSPDRYNKIVRYSLVQEQPTVWGTNASESSVFNSPATAATVIRLRFTELLFGADVSVRRSLNKNNSWSGTMALSDCKLRNIYLYVNNTDMYRTPILALTNNIIQQGDFTIVQGSGSYPNPQEFYAWNNLFLSGSMSAIWLTNTYPWAIRDNLFAALVPSVTGTPPAGNNGYTGGSATFGGTSNKLLLTLDWQTGALGPYYNPTSGISVGLTNLLNLGSRNATTASLYHHTTTTNQVKEGSSVVDIGYHYIALNTEGKPNDQDGDGVPDYLEDANGDGTNSGSETNWQASDSGIGGSTTLIVFTLLK